MNIKVLGTGCARCHELLKRTTEVVQELAIDTTVEDVKDIQTIIRYNVISTPALVINDKVVSTGNVPNKKELAQIILKAKEDIK
jgi:small redox-active disulfide protein 2